MNLSVERLRQDEDYRYWRKVWAPQLEAEEGRDFLLGQVDYLTRTKETTVGLVQFAAAVKLQGILDYLATTEEGAPA